MARVVPATMHIEADRDRSLHEGLSHPILT
jgi:hypothetical protein